VKVATSEAVTTEVVPTASAEFKVEKAPLKLLKLLHHKKGKQSRLSRVLSFFTPGGSKSMLVAALLAFFLGVFGIHRFYLGYTEQGLMQLIGYSLGTILILIGLAMAYATTGIALPAVLIIGALLVTAVGIWSFIDFIRILTNDLKPNGGDYSDD
jgi:apolipoprotein N-acyltransferase